MGPWELISLEKARQLSVSCVADCRRQSETVGLREAMGRVAAVDFVSTEDNPPFDRSTVDGFALRSSDVTTASLDHPAALAVVGEVRMGSPAGEKVLQGQAVRIPTGGMLPAGADAVVMQEDTRLPGTESVLVLRPVPAGSNLIRRGDDALAGSVVVRAGQRILVPDLGVLASCGVAQVAVVKKPVVAIVTTGDEIIPPGVVPKPGQIRDVNSFTLAALAEAAGCEVRLMEQTPDSQASLVSVLQTALNDSDVILISGGSSVGDRDFTTTAVQALPGVKIMFHGVALKPGKPTLMAKVGKTVIFGVPGHTVAAMTVFQEIVEPALLALQGLTYTAPVFVIHAKLAASMLPDAERDEIFRVQLEQSGDEILARPLPAKSGLITVMTRAHGMVYAKAGQREMQAGEIVEVRILTDRVQGNWQGVLR